MPSLLVGAERRERRLRSAVLVASMGFEPIEAGARIGIEHGRGGVVVTGEPGPGRCDAVAPRRLSGELVSARAGLRDSRDFNWLLIELGLALCGAAPVGPRHG
jgi:hypothetical protein